MSAGELLLKVISVRNFKRLRRLYHRLKFSLYPKLTEDTFRKILTDRLGIKKDSVVFIHSALDNLNISFPFYRVLPILSDVVGKDGTLVFPCWHFTETAIEYLKKKEAVFSIRKSPTVLGIIPELARRYPGAHRSLHPTNSVVAIGKYAEEITKDHRFSELPCDENSPFYRIINYNGFIVGLGVSTYNLSFVHCVEDIMKEKFPLKTRTDEVFETMAIDGEGKKLMMKTKAAHPRIKHRNIQKYIRNYIPPQICRDLNINGTKYFTANAKALFDKMEELAKDGITIYTKSE